MPIAGETLSDSVSYDAADDAKEWSLNGEKVRIAVKKA